MFTCEANLSTDTDGGASYSYTPCQQPAKCLLDMTKGSVMLRFLCDEHIEELKRVCDVIPEEWLVIRHKQPTKPLTT